MRKQLVLSVAALTCFSMAQGTTKKAPSPTSAWNSDPDGIIAPQMAVDKARQLNGKPCQDRMRLTLSPGTIPTDYSELRQLRQEIFQQLKSTFSRSGKPYEVRYDNNMMWGWTKEKGSRHTFRFSFLNKAGLWEFECPF